MSTCTFKYIAKKKIVLFLFMTTSNQKKCKWMKNSKQKNKKEVQCTNDSSHIWNVWSITRNQTRGVLQKIERIQTEDKLEDN